LLRKVNGLISLRMSGAYQRARLLSKLWGSRAEREPVVSDDDADDDDDDDDASFHSKSEVYW